MMDIWQNTHIAEQSLISGHFPPSGQFLFLFFFLITCNATDIFNDNWLQAE